MRVFLVALLVVVGLLPGVANAANEPIFAPAPEWVEMVQIPAANPKHSDRPHQLLLFTAQTSHAPDASTRYLETAGKIQTAEGLAAWGTIPIAWQPDRSDLVIHKLEVIRDGVARDVLAAQKFSVLRRESNLEAALLDGVLTATIQPEDLRVGDIVHYAFSIRGKPGSVALKPEDAVGVAPGTKSGLVLVRQIWPDGVPMRWAGSPAMGKVETRKTSFGNELRAELRDVELPLPPPAAPARFHSTMYLEATSYKDWAELSALLAPLYEKASSLPENSPLKAEARLIAAASRAPKPRAMAALRLVQDKIRYLALTMEEGGYLPASAEETWNRRFGDCKGKTAILLALLKELGIDAEPVLVNTIAGDVLSLRLPQARLFNHVLVHARIDGKSYWLDGARTGDRDLEELSSSKYRFGLPIRGRAATLIELPSAPPLKPLVETRITYDASAGMFLPIDAQGEAIFRGDLATGFRLALAQVGEEELKKAFNSEPYFPAVKDRVLRFKADPDQGTFTVSFSARMTMFWSNQGTPRFRFSNSTIRWQPNFAEKRDAANEQVPFLLGFPSYLAMHEEIILPAGGKGFALQGESFDRTIAGSRIARSLSLENGRAIAKSTFITLQPELSAADAKDTAAALAEISADVALVAPVPGQRISDGEVKTILTGEPVTASDFIERGFQRAERQRTAEALADYDRAIQLAPDSSLAHARRAMALIDYARLDEAEVAINKALNVPRVDPRSWLARGLLLARRGRPEEAIEEFSRYLREYNPESAMSLLERALAYEKIGQLEKARTDLQSMLALVPKTFGYVALARVTARMGNVKEARDIADKSVFEADVANITPWRKAYLLALRRGRVLRMAGRPELALAEFEAALSEFDARLNQLAATPDTDLNSEALDLLTMKVDLLAILARTQEAIAVADRVLTARPDHAAMLTARCLARIRGSVELGKARQDCDDAKRYDRANSDSWYGSGLLSLKSNDWKRAASEFQGALNGIPNAPRALFGAGIAKLRTGDTADGNWSIELARGMSVDVEAEFEEFGIRPGSVADEASVKALTGVTLYTWGSDGRPTREPVTADDFIARGYHRMVKHDLKEALADIDKGIELAPDSSLALSLRALTLIRLARLDEAEAAISKALSRETVEQRSFQIRGLLHARRGRLKEAIEDLSRELHPEPISAVWLVERGLAYEQLGELDKARADLEQAAALLPSAHRRSLLARVTARLGKLDEAIAIVDKDAPALDAANTPAWTKAYVLALRRGRILDTAGQAERARAGYEAALREVDARLKQLATPYGPAGLRLNKAMVDLLILADRTQEAVALADQVLTQQPDNVALLTVRCQARLHASLELAKARQDCDAAQTKDPTNRQVTYTSGLLFLKANDWKRALGEFDAVIKETPRSPGALFGRGIAKLRRGEKEDGGADIELARNLSAEVDAEFVKLGIKP